MKYFYFLSYRILLISKTSESPEKTSCITGLERSAQIPIDHFSVQSSSKRRPLHAGNGLVDDISLDSAGFEFLTKPCLSSICASGDIVLGKSPVVEEVLCDQRIEYGF